MSDEHLEAITLANKLLDEPNADPDDDLRTLARQFLRAEERIARLVELIRLVAVPARQAINLRIDEDYRAAHHALREWERENKCRIPIRREGQL